MNERERVVELYEETGAMSNLCREFGGSRKAGRKRAGRYFELGAPGLADALVRARRRYPFWVHSSCAACAVIR